ncbi:MAG: hypothetical protein B7X41_11240 [Microbacterium sp. 14-71-5]|nr:MAG: hypothetical protein B7X41_11240 [Microbacterium sp. 14-71-5]
MGFQTPQFKIGVLLEWAASGKIQLPDFQREYKWDDERIRQLLVTVLRGHPMGVIMLLQTGNDQVRFKPKPITGVASTVGSPSYLLLDGQQRMTSLFQALTGDGVVETVDDRKKKLVRRYFLDVVRALGEPSEQDDAILSLPQDGVLRSNFGRTIELDVSTHEGQVAQGIMPLNVLVSGDPTAWMLDYMNAGGQAEIAARSAIFTRFNADVITQVKNYELPAIELDSSTSKEAVATVFEKVNTGGLPLDVFELLTSTFAGDPHYFAAHGTDFRLGEDWKLTEQVVAEHSVLQGLQRTDFLQAVTLLATRERRARDIAAGRPKPSAVSARREDILRLELTDYLTWAPRVRDALKWAAKFLTTQHIHTADFVPYRTQIVPLATLRVVLGEQIDVYGTLNRVRQWYWCGVLGELYGSTTETRFARDTEQVPPWAVDFDGTADVAAPDTVKLAGFFESRLLSLRTRGSAAYKGIYALLMSNGCKDWKLDQQIEHSSYLEMQVDIHHIFPRAWCEKTRIDHDRQESIVNKTPLAKKTNIFISGDSPADYVPRIEATSGLDPQALDHILQGHLIDPASLRTADFDAFFSARKSSLLNLIEGAMGKAAVRDVADADTFEAPDAFEPEPEDLDPTAFDEESDEMASIGADH